MTINIDPATGENKILGFDEEYIKAVASTVSKNCQASKVQLNVEAIQDLVETELMKIGAFDLAKRYITYRYRHALLRKANWGINKAM